MIAYLVTRHDGMLEWARRRGFAATVIAHIDPHEMQPGDAVYGNFPLHIAAALCARGVAVWELVMTLTPEQRGQSLSADDMERAGAHFVRYFVREAPRQD